MITEAILGALLWVARGLVGLIPTLSLPVDQLGALDGLVDLLALINWFFPLGLIGEFLAIWLGLEVFETGKRVIDFVLAKIPGVR